MTVPSWVQDAIFYQIFPDRFANGDPDNDPPNVQPWGTPPTRHGFQGGDLRGIVQKLDYLVDLGVNAIYLNPIFQSSSNHRYNTTDYFKIDPKLGDLADFRALIEAAHRQGIRVILDGVFNHCGRGFFAFNDVLENEAASPYLNWFHIKKFPLQAYTPGQASNYEAWWGIKSLPKFNTDEPAVRRYLLDVSRYWIEQGADGWRLDVPNEIDDDSFWAEFREVVRTANPDAYLLGEIWESVPRWANDAHFDGLMNYPARAAILEYLTGKLTSQQFGERVENLLTTYAHDNTYAMYFPLGSHDTERALTYFGGSTEKMRLALLFQFAYPGAPAVYYGDEIGMRGGKDPDCRRAFPWDAAQWDASLHQWVRTLIAVRKTSPALRGGDYHRLYAGDHPPVYAFTRSQGDDIVLVILNAGATSARLTIALNGSGLENSSRLRSLLDSREITVENGEARVALEPFTGLYLCQATNLGRAEQPHTH